MSRYDIEARFERQIREHFRGYFVARVAGSKRPVDLVAVRKSFLQPVGKIATVLFIQCKARRRSRKLGPFEQREASELIVLAARFGASAVWAERVGRNVSYNWLGSR
jgi:Holliday junction resolvase